MHVEAFAAGHVEAAARLVLDAYMNERRAVPALPDGDYLQILPGLIADMAGGGLGVAAVEGGELIGFLTCYKPWDNHFGTAKGTFSPVHGHGARGGDRGRLYSLLYQAAAERWVARGVLSHTIGVFAHDQDAVQSFFWNGFGLRTIDAIRPVEPIACGDIPACAFRELPPDEIERVVPLKNGLIGHLRGSPMFMPLSQIRDAGQVREQNERRGSRYFIAEAGGEAIAFLEIMPQGENFACDDPGTINICGAYMVPQHRGSGIYTGLLAHLMEAAAREGYTRCGVDFESFNPTAMGFWLKYFTAYTHGMVRRIDERIYGK